MKNFLSAKSDDQRVLVEAIASWTENLRDIITASSGLHDAIVTTADFSPHCIAQPLQRLAASLRYQPLEIALREFSDDVAHPTCDFVVSALIISAENQARDLAQLLSHLAACARSECDLYMRIWVSRARARTAVRIVTGAVVVFFGAMMLLSRSYLAPFFSPQGAFVFFAVVSIFVISIQWMTRIARIEVPQRFLTTRPQGTS